VAAGGAVGEGDRGAQGGVGLQEGVAGGSRGGEGTGEEGEGVDRLVGC